MYGNAEENVNDTTSSSAAIKKPIAFLVVNFVYFYTVLIMAICLYGLYGRAGTPSSPDAFPKVEYPPSIDDDDDDDRTMATADGCQSADDGRQSSSNDNSNYFSLDILHVPKLDDADRPRWWTGDWNEYWNRKTDY